MSCRCHITTLANNISENIINGMCNCDNLKELTKELVKAKNALISLGLRSAKRIMKGATGVLAKSCLNL